MVHQKRSKLDNCSQPISESDDINSESLPAKDDDYNCDSDDNSASHVSLFYISISLICNIVVFFISICKFMKSLQLYILIAW